MDPVLVFISVVAALSAALLAWFAIDVGSATLARYRASFTERTQFQVQEFFLFIDPRKIFIANLGVMGAGAALAALVSGNTLLAIPAFFILGWLPRLTYGWLRRRRLLRFEEQLPDALTMLSGALRAGLGLNAAIAQLVIEAQPPLVQEFSLMLREQRLGVTQEQSLNALARRIPTQTTVLAVAAMRIAAETGGGLAEMLERTANTVRSRLQMEGKIRALTAQGKLQAWVVGLLPVALMLVLNRMEPDAMDLLWHTRAGWGALTLMAFLETMGMYLIRKIAAIDV
jgi:tight adherence protein B